MKDVAPDTLDPAVDPPQPDEPPPPPAWRTHVATWAAPAIVALLIVAIIGLTGGFNRAPAYKGPLAEPGQLIETRFWDVTVHRAGITGTQGVPAALSLRVTLRSKLDESHRGLTQEVLIVRLPDGTALGTSTCFQVQDSYANTQFSPEVPTDAICAFEFVLNGYDFAGEDRPLDVEVYVLDQAPAAHDFTRSGEPEVLLPPVAHLQLVAEWLVT